MPTITGTAGADVLTGTASDDVLVGLGGNDTLTGGPGSDWIVAGQNESDGTDTVVYLSVADSPISGPIDVVTVSGFDRFDFSALNPTSIILSHTTQNLYSVGVIQAYLTVRTATGDLQVLLDSRTGLNYLDFGFSGPMIIIGSSDHNLLDGGPGNDVVYGNGGNDYFLPHAGSDVLYGGAGQDTFAFGNGSDSPLSAFDLIADFEQGADVIEFNFSNGRPGVVRTESGGSFAFSQADSGLASLGISGLVTVGVLGVGLNGTDFSHPFYIGITILGASLHERIIGSNGTDTLDGGAGNDTVDGGSGIDRIIGGKGFDALFGGSGADTFAYTDRLDSTVAQADIIFDFVSGQEKIDLTAVRTGANDRFGIAYQGTGSFLFVDLGGEGTYDMLIQLANVHLLASDVNWGAASGAFEDRVKFGAAPEVLPGVDAVSGLSIQVDGFMPEADAAVLGAITSHQDWLV